MSTELLLVPIQPTDYLFTCRVGLRTSAWLAAVRVSCLELNNSLERTFWLRCCTYKGNSYVDLIQQLLWPSLTFWMDSMQLCFDQTWVAFGRRALLQISGLGGPKNFRCLDNTPFHLISTLCHRRNDIVLLLAVFWILCWKLGGLFLGVVCLQCQLGGFSS